MHLPDFLQPPIYLSPEVADTMGRLGITGVIPNMESIERIREEALGGLGDPDPSAPDSPVDPVFTAFIFRTINEAPHDKAPDRHYSLAAGASIQPGYRPDGTGYGTVEMVVDPSSFGSKPHVLAGDLVMAYMHPSMSARDIVPALLKAIREDWRWLKRGESLGGPPPSSENPPIEIVAPVAAVLERIRCRRGKYPHPFTFVMQSQIES